MSGEVRKRLAAFLRQHAKELGRIADELDKTS